jgi:hypothetical protein
VNVVNGKDDIWITLGVVIALVAFALDSRRECYYSEFVDRDEQRKQVLRG